MSPGDDQRLIDKKNKDKNVMFSKQAKNKIESLYLNDAAFEKENRHFVD